MAREVNHPIIASGTVAANLLRFSNATGAYFVDTTDATLAAALAAAVKHNDIIEVLDGSKRAIRFVAKSQGTGETESEKFVAPLILQEGWTDNLDGSYTGVTTSFGVYRGTPVLGALYKPAFTIDIRTAGTVVAFVHTASAVTVESGFNPNSATFSYLVEELGSVAITSSAMHASMVAGTAFFFHDSIDFSSFAVGPSGKYLVAMYDSAGRVAWGYGKAAGVTTDPTPFGLTITSTPDGTTYNWAQITTGFDANAVTSVKVWRAL